jgi:hypothetical protein
MGWELFYELNKGFINLHLIVGSVMLVLLPIVSYVVQIVSGIKEYMKELYEDIL